ncbi:hypothetical protein H2200_007151 [Cladophialophora chaetospira]|uniref:ribonuclease T2 n=1 Tax=Cladophialophora chaetospira TaxID=386627 RepID=A0AA38X7E5_9EURO|nr:hypothetical protein H2200_007151 [Cladophialophora chaetospira]
MALKKCVALAVAVTTTAQASLYNETKVNHTCILDPLVLSCSKQAQPNLVDTCCTETYGGLLLSTQFWSTYTGLEDQGQKLPADTWTLHGLWPDFCNGSYTQYCDLTRQYDPTPSPNTTNGLPNGTVVPPYKGPNVGTFVSNFGRLDLLNWMNTYWINQGAPNSDFWGHEFSKHATCYSTFDLPCYGPNYVEHQEVIEFFETAIKYYRRLPTWSWLKEANITPSNSTTYTLGDIQGQLAKKFKATPYVGCSGPRYNETEQGMKAKSNDTGRTVVSEVWYYMHAYGRPQEGNTVPVNATGSNTSCAKAKGALHYYEVTPSSVQGS